MINAVIVFEKVYGNTAEVVELKIEILWLSICVFSLGILISGGGRELIIDSPMNC